MAVVVAAGESPAPIMKGHKMKLSYLDYLTVSAGILLLLAASCTPAPALL